MRGENKRALHGCSVACSKGTIAGGNRGTVSREYLVNIDLGRGTAQKRVTGGRWGPFLTRMFHV